GSFANAAISGAIAGGLVAAVPAIGGFGLVTDFAANAAVGGAIGATSQVSANLITGAPVGQGVAANAIGNGLASGGMNSILGNIPDPPNMADPFTNAYANGLTNSLGNGLSSLPGGASSLCECMQK